MSRGIKQHSRAGGSVDSDLQTMQGSAPGKVTRTSKLPAAVQRKRQAGRPEVPVVQKKPSRQWATDSHIEAALCGTAMPEVSSPVQARGGASGNVQQAAAQGVSGSGGSLPHLDQIQSAFGDHDVSDVQAHVGGAATGACEQMGAMAYATGNQVAFKSAPDLHTAAHEAAHVVQQRQGVQLKDGVGQSGDAYERQADQVADAVVSGQSATALLDGSPGADKGGAAAGGAIQRRDEDDTIGVDVVEIPAKQGSVKDIVLDSMNTIEGMLVNYKGALQNFETVVNNESQEEAAPKSSGLIALEETGKFLFDKTADYASTLIPGGAVAKGLLDLGKSILGAVDKEQKRAARASENNALKNFITSLRTQIVTAQSSLLASKQDDAVAAQAEYDSRDEGGQWAYRSHHETQNHFLTQALTSSFTVGAQFTRISESWINNSQAPGKSYAARVVIKLDKDWNVLTAYIDAPRGSRIAEQLANQPGDVDLTALDVPRVVYWYPQSDEEAGGLSWCTAQITADSKITSLSANILGSHFYDKFVELISSKPIPNTVNLSGAKTE